MQYLDYKHVTPIQIRFSDIDRLNHVNNACYLNYFELGRIKYFNDVYKEKINWDEKGFILARTEIDHLAPVFLTDEIYCFSKVIKIGTKSITIQNSIVKKEKDVLIPCANGKVVLVAMDYSINQSIQLPERWIELMKQYEG
jgi:acyl-CoA thioester hydrolase